MRRVGLLLIAAVWLLLAFERPAAAHGAGGIEATNFETTLGGVTPALPGVRVRLIDTGSRLELRNAGPEVVVLGAVDEPYLRIGPDGAFENRRSPTAGLNRQQVHDTAPPPNPDPLAPPDWHKLSDAPVARWRDHRAHWVASRNPPAVDSAPGERHVVYPRWEVGLRRGVEKATVFGQLTWVPGPSRAPWFGLMAGAFLVTGALGLLRRWGPALAAVTAVVLTLDVVHASSVAFSFDGGLGTRLGRVVTGSLYGMVGWVLAGLAIRLLRRSKVDGLYAGVFAGLSIALFGGLLDLATLSRSNTATALPIDVARLCVALTAGAGLGLAAACLLVIQRTPDARRVVGGPAGSDQDEADADGDGALRGGNATRPDVLAVGGRAEPQD